MKPCSRQMRVEEAVHLDPGQGVERAEGLVEQQHARPADQGAGKRHALLLPTRKHGRPVARPIGKADVGERGTCRIAPTRLSRAMPTFPMTRCQGRSRGVLEEEPHVALQAPHRRTVDNDTSPALCRVEAGDQPKQRRLAAAGAAEPRRRTARWGIARSVPRSTSRSPKLLCTPFSLTGRPRCVSRAPHPRRSSGRGQPSASAEIAAAPGQGARTTATSRHAGAATPEAVW